MKKLKINQKITFRNNNSLIQYMREVSKTPILSPEQENNLAEKAINGDKEAAKILVVSNLRFVISVAKNYTTDKIMLEDLINEGNIGLIKALEKFDPNKGYKFISFAVWWIRKIIIEYISNYSLTVRIPANRINDLSKLNKFISSVEQKNNYKADIEEVISEFYKEMSTKDFILLNNLNSMSIDSLDREIQSKDGESNITYVSDLIVDEEDNKTDYLLNNSDIKYQIEAALSMLTPRNKKIIEMLFGLNGYEPMTLQEVGNNFGLTREMIRQVRDKSLKLMRENKIIQIVS